MRHRPIEAYAFLLLFFAQPQPVIAESLMVSQFGGASTSSRSVAKTDTQFVYEVLLKMLDRWNAHDIDGLMSVYWNSPSLLALIDTEQFDGWENLYRSYKAQYRNLTNMGTVNPTRVEVKLLEPDLAFGVISWTIRYPENAHASEIVGTSTMDIQKFDSVWKIVALHTSFTEM
jgi:ketosteroid isomerase-like protein